MTENDSQQTPLPRLAPMMPQEVYDAWREQIATGTSAAFLRMLEQLRQGQLVMETREEGQLIRAATPAEVATAQPHAFQGEGTCQYGGPEGCDSGVQCGRHHLHPVHHSIR